MNEHNQSHPGKSIAKGNMLIRALIAFFGIIAVALTAYLVWALANAGTNTQSSTLMLTPVVTGAPRHVTFLAQAHLKRQLQTK